jgi:hypothetical protein
LLPMFTISLLDRLTAYGLHQDTAQLLFAGHVHHRTLIACVGYQVFQVKACRNKLVVGLRVCSLQQFLLESKILYTVKPVK